MKISIAIDANVILSALLGGKARIILFEPQFKFLTTIFNLKEVERYLPEIQKQTGISEKELSYYLSLLPLKIMPKSFYKAKLEEARKIIGETDPHDIDLLALSLKLNIPIWSEDKHFEKTKNRIKLLKTKDLL